MVMRPIFALALFVFSFSALSQVALAQVNVTVHNTTLNVSTHNQYLNITIGNGDTSWNRNVTDVVIFFPGPAEFEFVNGSNFTTASDVSFVTYPHNYFQVSWNNTTSVGIIPHGSSRNFSIRINTPASTGDHTVSVFTYFSNNATPEINYKTINLVQIPPTEIEVKSGILVVDTTFPNTLEMNSNDPSIFHINGVYYVFYDTGNGQGYINYTTSLNGTGWNPPKNATTSLTTQLSGSGGVYWNSTDFILVKRTNHGNGHRHPMIKACRPSVDKEVLSCGREVFNPEIQGHGHRWNVIELKDPNIETVLFSSTDSLNKGVWGIWNDSSELIPISINDTNGTVNSTILVKGPGNFTASMQLSTVSPTESAPQWTELNDTAAVVFYPVYDGVSFTNRPLFERVYRHGFGLGTEREILSNGNDGVIRPVLDDEGNLYVAYMNTFTKTIHVLARNPGGSYKNIDTRVPSSSAGFVDTTMSIDRASGALFLFHGNNSGVFMSYSMNDSSQIWSKEIKIANLLTSNSFSSRSSIGAQTNESTSGGQRIIPLMWEEAGKVIAYTYVISPLTPPFGSLKNITTPPIDATLNISQDVTLFHIYNGSLNIEASVTSKNHSITWVKLTIYNSTFSTTVSMILSEGIPANGIWKKGITYNNPIEFLYPGDYSFYVNASDGIVTVNSNVFNFTVLNNVQNIGFTIYPGPLLRLNRTGDLIILQGHVSIQYTSMFSTLKFNYSLSNATHSIPIDARNISYLESIGGDAYDSPTCGYSRYMSCKFRINTSKLRPNSLYNLTFNATDLFGNFYQPSTVIKVTPQINSKNDYNVSTGTQLLDDRNNTNSSLLFHSKGLSGVISIATYNETPSHIRAYDPFNTSLFVEFIPSWENAYPSLPAGSWAEIRIHYTDQQIANLGLDESALKLQSYNETTQSWQICGSGGVNTTGNYVFCNSTHFSIWGITGNPTSTGSSNSPTSSSSGSASSGGGGSGGGSGAAVATTDSASDTKTVKTEETSESPEANEIGTGTIEESAPARNVTNERQENLVTGLFALGGANTLSVILAVIIVGGITSFLLWRKIVGVRKKVLSRNLNVFNNSFCPDL